MTKEKPPAEEPDELDAWREAGDEGPTTSAQEWRTNPYTLKVQRELAIRVLVNLKALYVHCRDASSDPAARGKAAEISALETFAIMCGGVPLTRITDKERKAIGR